MKKKLFIGMLVTVSIIILSLPASARKPGFGNLYYNDVMVRTVIPPAAMPFQGRDNLYAFPPGEAAEGQLAVTAVAPGDPEYHGGQWAVHVVDWNVTPYLLTSEEAVLAAADAGDITVERVAENDFKCPVQP
jgi:hypothetical protein